MFNLSRTTARFAVVASFAALLAAACNPDSNGPLSPTLSAHGQGDGGSAQSGFSVLANAAVTCTRGGIIGDVGTFVGPGAPGAITLNEGCLITGASDIGGPAAVAAYNAFLVQYAALAPQAGDVCPIITGTLAGQSFAPGVYCVSEEAKTGVVTLNGPANGTWTFKVAPGAFTGTSFQVIMAGGARACNVTWWVDAATTMTDSDLKGTVLSGAAATLTRGTLIGRVFAKADVTVTGTAVTGCVGSGNGGGNGGHPKCDPRGDDDDDKGHKRHHKDKHHGDKDKHQDKDRHDD